MNLADVASKAAWARSYELAKARSELPNAIESALAGNSFERRVFLLQQQLRTCDATPRYVSVGWQSHRITKATAKVISAHARDASELRQSDSLSNVRLDVREYVREPPWRDRAMVGLRTPYRKSVH